MDTKKHRQRSALYSLMLCLMVAAGLARISMALTHNDQPHRHLHSASSETVTIRRNVQLVTCAIQALLARQGMTLLDAVDTASVAGGYNFDGSM